MFNTLSAAPGSGTYMLRRRTPIVRVFALFMGMLLIVSAGFLVMTRSAEATRISYCASGESHAGEALHVSLLQQGAQDPVRMRTGETTSDGCGEFYIMSSQRPVMIVVWTGDGSSTGSTGWIDPAGVDGTVTIVLKSRASPQAG